MSVHVTHTTRHYISVKTVDGEMKRQQLFVGSRDNYMELEVSIFHKASCIPNYLQRIITLTWLSLGYVEVAPVSGYSSIDCQGTEATLDECDIGEVSHSCSHVGVVEQCSNGKFFLALFSDMQIYM